MNANNHLVQFYFAAPGDLGIADLRSPGTVADISTWARSRLRHLQIASRPPDQLAPRRGRVVAPDGEVLAEFGPVAVEMPSHP